jgi:hypothetical protein
MLHVPSRSSQPARRLLPDLSFHRLAEMARAPTSSSPRARGTQQSHGLGIARRISPTREEALAQVADRDSQTIKPRRFGS